jgi:hypothetical protein
VKRQELFTDDLAVLHRVNADLGQFSPLLRILVGNIRIVLHNEAIVRYERSVGGEAMHFCCVYPPVDFATDSFFPARFRRAAAHAKCFYAHNVVVVKRVERFVPCLFADQVTTLLAASLVVISLLYLNDLARRTSTYVGNSPGTL